MMLAVCFITNRCKMLFLLHVGLKLRAAGPVLAFMYITLEVLCLACLWRNTPILFAKGQGNDKQANFFFLLSSRQ
jgi:hypothetical protein